MPIDKALAEAAERPMERAPISFDSSVPRAASRDEKRAGMLDEAHQKDVVNRLNRIEGQIRGIRRMVQEPRLCVEILQQLAAAEAALGRTSLTIFRYHVEKCVPDGINHGAAEQRRRLAELVDIFDRFSR